jgi:hypothetical protein
MRYLQHHGIIWGGYLEYMEAIYRLRSRSRSRKRPPNHKLLVVARSPPSFFLSLLTGLCRVICLEQDFASALKTFVNFEAHSTQDKSWSRSRRNYRVALFHGDGPATDPEL